MQCQPAQPAARTPNRVMYEMTYDSRAAFRGPLESQSFSSPRAPYILSELSGFSIGTYRSCTRSPAPIFECNYYLVCSNGPDPRWKERKASEGLLSGITGWKRICCMYLHADRRLPGNLVRHCSMQYVCNTSYAVRGRW